MGCAALFTYLTGFRAAEVRPYSTEGLSRDGVRVISAKRKKGQEEITKVREWSTRLRVVVARAKQTHGRPREFLFATSSGSAYTRSGWGSTWVDVMFEYIATEDTAVAVELAKKKTREAHYKRAYDNGQETPERESSFTITKHNMYFALSDIRPAAITTKLRNRDVDAYDFAAHANPATTHKHYDRRQEKRAKATE